MFISLRRLIGSLQFGSLLKYQMKQHLWYMYLHCQTSKNARFDVEIGMIWLRWGCISLVASRPMAMGSAIGQLWLACKTAFSGWNILPLLVYELQIISLAIWRKRNTMRVCLLPLNIPDKLHCCHAMTYRRTPTVDAWSVAESTTVGVRRCVFLYRFAVLIEKKRIHVNQSK